MKILILLIQYLILPSVIPFEKKEFIKIFLVNYSIFNNVITPFKNLRMIYIFFVSLIYFLMFNKYFKII